MFVPYYIEKYIDDYKTGKIKLNKERKLLIKLVEESILKIEGAYFDLEMIEDYITFTNRYFFPLQDFQKFMASFIFMYQEDGTLVFDEFFYYMARGAGKNGFLSSVVAFLISPLHGIRNYNVSVVANSEEQAKTSFDEIYNIIDLEDNLKNFFDNKKSVIECYETKAQFKFRTSNADTKDGLRDGAVIFDEIHQYESSSIVDVFTSGLGKVKNPRIFYIGTDGYVRDGYIDKLKERAMNILNQEVSIEDDPLFPFMCCIDDENEMHDTEQWEKANPMFHKPMGDYAKTLFKTILKQYKKLENDPSGYEEFITKRMNLPKVDLEKNVAPWEQILMTNQPYELERLKERECVGSLDYASIRDFVSVGLLFVEGKRYYFPKELTHSYACKNFVDKHYAYSKEKHEGNNKKDHRKFAPIREWENEGLITIVDRDTMDPELIVEWFVQKRDEGWIIKKIVADNFRMEVLRGLFEREGFELEVIRNPDAASALLSPRIELGFSEGHFIFGDNPIMRWYTNNVLVKILPNGNKIYKKKEKVKRKTDGFMAFLYGLWGARDLDNTEYDSESMSIFDLDF